MITDKIGVTDIVNIGAHGKIEATLPNEDSVKSAKSLVSWVKKTYPREDGLTYTTKVISGTTTIIIAVVEPWNVRRKNLKRQ